MIPFAGVIAVKLSKQIFNVATVSFRCIGCQWCSAASRQNTGSLAG